MSAWAAVKPPSVNKPSAKAVEALYVWREKSLKVSEIRFIMFFKMGEHHPIKKNQN
jgi:hypothetical protein